MNEYVNEPMGNPVDAHVNEPLHAPVASHADGRVVNGHVADGDPYERMNGPMPVRVNAASIPHPHDPADHREDRVDVDHDGLGPIVVERFTVRAAEAALFGRTVTFVALDNKEDTFVVEFDATGNGTIDGDATICAADAAVIVGNDPTHTMYVATALVSTPFMASLPTALASLVNNPTDYSHVGTSDHPTDDPTGDNHVDPTHYLKVDTTNHATAYVGQDAVDDPNREVMDDSDDHPYREGIDDPDNRPNHFPLLGKHEDRADHATDRHADYSADRRPDYPADRSTARLADYPVNHSADDSTDDSLFDQIDEPVDAPAPMPVRANRAPRLEQE